MRGAIVSGIVPGNAPISYWLIFFSLSLVTVPEVFAKVDSPQFPSCVANFKNMKGPVSQNLPKFKTK